MEQDLNEWQFLSLITFSGITYDFRFKTRRDCCDFIITISEIGFKMSSQFFGFTNQKLVLVNMTRIKCHKIAKV